MKRIKVYTSSDHYDMIIGFASIWPVDGIWEQDDHVELFVEDTDESVVLTLLNDLPTGLTKRLVVSDMEAINWNQDWESNFDMVQVDDFCLIYAPFHTDLPETKHKVQLMPKMAFGTGHHETTYMMIQQMASFDFQDKSVLDFGCGTAILSILADKLGATDILAIDHEEPAVRNSLENTAVNGINSIIVQQGTLDEVVIKPYDYILANINYNVLKNTPEQLKDYVHESSRLIMSGVLIEQANDIIEIYHKSGWTTLASELRGDFSCMVMKLTLQ